MQNTDEEIPEYNADVLGDDHSEENNNQPLPIDKYTFSIAHCKICLDTLKNPVSLPCGHNFCNTCLINQTVNIQESRSSSCWVCRTSYVEFLKNNGKCRIKPNHLLDLLLRLFGQLFAENPDETEAMVQRMLMATTTEPVEPLDNVMDNIYTLLTTQHDIDRIGVYIAQLRKTQRRATIRMGNLASELAVRKISHPADMAVNDRLHLTNLNIIKEAVVQFRTLRQPVYNVILIQTRASDFVHPTKFFDMPVRGITATTSIVIVQCTAHDIPTINEFFDNNNIVYEAIVAIWQEEEMSAAARARNVSARSRVTHFFVAGTVGQMRVFQAKNTKNKVLTVTTSSLMEGDLPLQLFAELTSLLSIYHARCVINSTITCRPDGWDICERPPGQQQQEKQ